MAAFNILVLAIFFIFLGGFQDTNAKNNPPDANSPERKVLSIASFDRYPIDEPNPVVSFGTALLKNHREIEISDFSSNIPDDAYFYATESDSHWDHNTGKFVDNANFGTIPSLQLSIDMKCENSIKMVEKKNIKIELGDGYGFDVYMFAVLASKTHVYLKLNLGTVHNSWGICYMGKVDAPLCNCIPASDATKECRKTLDEPCEKALAESRTSPTAGVTPTAGPDITVTASTTATAGTNTAGNTNVTTAKPATTESEQEIPPPPSSAFAIKGILSIILVILGLKSILS